MSKANLKNEILLSIDKFINANFDDFIKNASAASSSRLDEAEVREAVNKIVSSFNEIKKDNSILNVFTSLELLRIRDTIVTLIDSILSNFGNHIHILTQINALDINLLGLKIYDVTKKVSLSETEEAIGFFAKNKKDFEEGKKIFEQAIKNKDAYIEKNINILAVDFQKRSNKINFISGPKDLSKAGLFKRNANFLNLKSFWWFCLGLLFSAIALVVLYKAHGQTPIDVGAAIIRISSVFILMSLSSFAFLQFSHNQKLTEFYEFKIVALNVFQALHKAHTEGNEKAILMQKAIDIIFKEYSFKDKSIKTIASEIKELKELIR